MVLKIENNGIDHYHNDHLFKILNAKVWSLLRVKIVCKFSSFFSNFKPVSLKI